MTPRRNTGIKLLLSVIGLLLLFCLSAPQTKAQITTDSVYWQFGAVGELDHVWHADMDADGIEEFAIGAAQNRVSLLDAGGQPLWPEPYSAVNPIQQLLSAPLDPSNPGWHSLILSDAANLYALNQARELEWQLSLPAVPVQVAVYQPPEQRAAWFVVALESGELLVVDNTGVIQTVDLGLPTGPGAPAQNANPQLAIAPFLNATQPAIAFSYTRADNQSELFLLTPGGLVQQTTLPILISAITAADFIPGERALLALGGADGELLLYAGASQEWWRTPFVGHEITALAMMQHLSERFLIAGNDAGRLVAYDRFGRRQWTTPLTDNPINRILSISANPAGSVVGQSFSLAVSVGSLVQQDSQLVLLDRNGQALPDRYSSTSNQGLSRLVDINRDGHPELFLVRFSTGTLFDPGIGVGENLVNWTYDISAAPRTAEVVDINGDNQDELLIGARDGRLHLIENDGDELWVQSFAGEISFVEYLPRGVDDEPTIVVVHNLRQVGADGNESVIGNLAVLRANGAIFPDWGNEELTNTAITSLLIHDINRDNRPEIIIGTRSGEIVTLSLDRRIYWQTNIENGVEFLVGLDNGGNGRAALMAGNQTQQLRLISNKGAQSIPVTYFQDIVDIQPLVATGGLKTHLAVAIEDGGIRGLDDFGRSLWQYDLQADPLFAIPAGSNSFVVATDNDQLIRLATNGGENQANELWHIDDLGRISAVFWGDLDGDGWDDVAIGNRDGRLFLYGSDGRTRWGDLTLPSEVTFVRGMRRAANAPPELLVVTGNGFVTHFRAQANRPPLLVKPKVIVNNGQYSISVEAINVEENEAVQVTLELFNPVSGQWTVHSRQSSRNDPLLWQLNPNDLASAGVRYRFYYDDGTNQGRVEPAPGPAPELSPTSPNYLPMAIILGIMAVIAGGYVLRATRTLDARVARFYRRLKSNPAATMDLLEVAYNISGGSPDYLLNLSSRARAENNRLVASLADGLYLLADRPGAGLEIIESALQEGLAQGERWHKLATWHDFIAVSHALFKAPSITEITLLRPRYLTMLERRETPINLGASIGALEKPLNNLRDSERVELFEDRFVYLNAATTSLRELIQKLTWYPTSIEADILLALAERWSGLIEAEIEGLRGQARLVISLATQRVIPTDEATIVLEISNEGKAPAEQVQVELVPDPAYEVIRQPDLIPLLPAGRTRKANAIIRPLVADRFRLSSHISYSDRVEELRTIPFGDMVHLLTPVRDFSSVLNPYAPGTPLRRHSPLFYGREDIFNFITESASRRDQQQILILVGQRRTGKTSTLLRLGNHLPDDLVPVYIDCQSLGVVEGMGALFHDIAWLISDALLEKGIELPVPDMPIWQENPTNYFQRQFIPQALASLPDNARLLLVFDEFEAFEDLVKRDILPPTLFPYLRHLMQHGRRLNFVFVGTRRLEEMTSSYWSVLFNIALYKQIGFLNPEAAHRLITEPVAPNIIYDDLALDKILRVTAGHPYFLQLVCYTLINRANKEKSGYITISDVNAAIDEMLRLGEVHFAYMWQLSSHTERALLTAIAHHIEPDAPFHPIDLAQYLERFGIRLKPAEITTGLEALVEREILQEVN
ncbi:MAG: AAA family ATPase, partial [Anaerolineales bacterium]|nr:AAA family ATPase [Anaerolineales bacterium]